MKKDKEQKSKEFASWLHKNVEEFYGKECDPKDMYYKNGDIMLAFEIGWNEALKSQWRKYDKKSLPLEGEEVIAYNHKWINDFNPRGLRVGFLNGDEEFVSAYWWDYQDDYIALSKSKCESEPSFFERHLDNTEPEYWMPIPSFDNILEDNKDVLKRLKDK